MQLAPERVIKPMLAKAPKVKDGQPVIQYPVIAQVKYDGIRALVVDGVVRSRTFKPIPNLEIQAALSRFEGFDGEIIVGDPTAEGCMQATSSFVMAPEKTGADWTFQVFDLWNKGNEDYMARRELLRLDAVGWPDRLVRVPSFDIYDSAMLEAFETRTVAQGHEGVILRDPSAAYKHGRSGVKGPLLKLKRFIDFEAVITGVYEEMHNANEATKDAFGRTERSSVKANKHGKNTLGGFELRAINGPHEGDEFRCGTGFNREQRIKLWSSGHDYAADLVGRTVKIKSFPIGVKDLPRHPVFLGFRDMEIDG